MLDERYKLPYSHHRWTMSTKLLRFFTMNILSRVSDLVRSLDRVRPSSPLHCLWLVTLDVC